MAMDRRSFLKGAALLGGASTLVGVVGCSPTSSSEDSSSSTSSEQAAFESEAAYIEPVSEPEAWDEEVEVLIVGSGAGGINASMRLAQAGYNVLVLERQSEFNGNSKCSSMFANIGGHRLAEEVEWAYPSYPYEVSKMTEYFMDKHQMTSDPALIRAMVVNGPLCIDWMLDKAEAKWVASNPSSAGTGLLIWDGMYTNNFNVNTEPMAILTEKAQSDGAVFRADSEVTNLVFDGESVLGVLTEEGDEQRYIKASRAVILTAGGMEMNRAMMSKYSPTILPGIANIATPPNGTGECIRMGQGVGADISGCNTTGAFDGGVWWKEYGEYDTLMDAHINKDGNQVVRQPWLRVNLLGERVPYISTSGTQYPYQATGLSTSASGMCETGAIEMSQPEGKTFCVFDSKYDTLVTENYFEQEVCRHAHIVADDDVNIDRVPEWLRDWHTGFQLMIDGGAVAECDTIEELEEAMGLSEGLLADEVEKWNAACEAGQDYAELYAYPTEWLLPINEPPYYCAALGGHPFASKTGLRINPQMQVINTEGNVIPGLLAGWHTAGGSSGENNAAGSPLTGMYGDVGLSFIGGYMAAGTIIEEDGVIEG